MAAAGDLGFPVIELPPEASAAPEPAIRFLVAQLVQSGGLTPAHAERVVSQVLRREGLGATAIGGGVAVPHARSDAVDRVVGIVGRAAQPIPWPGAVDAAAVGVVCLLVTPASDPGASLRALEAVVRRLRGEPGAGPGASANPAPVQ